MMITLKNGFRFSLKLNNKKIKETAKVKAYFKHCEEIIAKELNSMAIDEFNELPWIMMIKKEK